MQLCKVCEAVSKFKEAQHTVNKYRALRDIRDKLQNGMANIFLQQKNIILEQLDYYENRFEEAFTNSDINKIIDAVTTATRGRMRQIILTNNEDAFEAGSEQIMTEIGVNIDFGLENPRAAEWLEERAAEMVTEINEETRSQLNTLLTNAGEKGWSPQKTAKKIEDRFDGFAGKKPQEHIRSRSELVAVTETAEAYEQANMMTVSQMQERGLEIEKYWSNMGDSKVSEGCKENTRADWIPLDEAFPSGHQRAPRFPGCRCDILYRRANSSRQRG